MNHIPPFYLSKHHFKVMRIFVTGGTGFIGTHVIARLIDSGNEVIAMRRKGSSPRLSLVHEPEWVDGSLDGDYRSALSECDLMMHLASHTPNPPYAELGECLFWNVSTAIALAEQAFEVGIKNYIIAGSCFEYGNSANNTFLLTPDTPLKPSLSYPISKAAASIAFTGWAREKGVRLKLIRIFQTFGPGENEYRLWPSLIRAAKMGIDFNMTKGEQLRDFIRVEDVANCFVKSLSLEKIIEGIPIITHAASGNPQTLLDFSSKIWNQYQATGNLKIGALPYRYNEIMKIVSHPNAIDPAIQNQ